MARLVLRENERGSVLLESISVLGVVLVLVSSLLLVAYVLFARAWIEYQAEQSLYCLAEGHSRRSCVKLVRERIEEFLPFGELSGLQMWEDGSWRVGVLWELNGYKYRVRRELSIKRVLKNRGLYW